MCDKVHNDTTARGYAHDYRGTVCIHLCGCYSLIQKPKMIKTIRSRPPKKREKK